MIEVGIGGIAIETKLARHIILLHDFQCFKDLETKIAKQIELQVQSPSDLTYMVEVKPQ